MTGDEELMAALRAYNTIPGTNQAAKMRAALKAAKAVELTRQGPAQVERMRTQLNFLKGKVTALTQKIRELESGQPEKWSDHTPLHHLNVPPR